MNMRLPQFCGTCPIGISSQAITQSNQSHPTPCDWVQSKHPCAAIQEASSLATPEPELSAGRTPLTQALLEVPPRLPLARIGPAHGHEPSTAACWLQDSPDASVATGISAVHFNPGSSTLLASGDMPDRSLFPRTHRDVGGTRLLANHRRRRRRLLGCVLY